MILRCDNQESGRHSCNLSFRVNFVFFAVHSYDLEIMAGGAKKFECFQSIV